MNKYNLFSQYNLNMLFQIYAFIYMCFLHVNIKKKEYKFIEKTYKCNNLFKEIREAVTLKIKIKC